MSERFLERLSKGISSEFSVVGQDVPLTLSRRN